VRTQLDTDTREAYRDVFLRNKSGKEVFASLLLRLGFYNDSVSTEAENAMRNFATELLVDLGIFQEKNIVNIVDVLSHLDYKESSNG
jgi:hypothetical protein